MVVARRGSEQVLGEAALASPKRGKQALLVGVRQQDLAHFRAPLNARRIVEAEFLSLVKIGGDASGIRIAAADNRLAKD
jgi:hypothetical protein